MQTEFARAQMITQQSTRVGRARRTRARCHATHAARIFRAGTLRGARVRRHRHPAARRTAHARTENCRTSPAGARSAARHARAGRRRRHRLRAGLPLGHGRERARRRNSMRSSPRRRAAISSAPASARSKSSRVTLSTWISARTMRSLRYVAPCPCTTNASLARWPWVARLFVVVGASCRRKPCWSPAPPKPPGAAPGLFETCVDALDNAPRPEPFQF